MSDSRSLPSTHSCCVSSHLVWLWFVPVRARTAPVGRVHVHARHLHFSGGPRRYRPLAGRVLRAANASTPPRLYLPEGHISQLSKATVLWKPVPKEFALLYLPESHG